MFACMANTPASLINQGATEHYYEIAKALLDHNADPNVQSKVSILYTYTTLHYTYIHDV